jgi:hypothetical protein
LELAGEEADALTAFIRNQFQIRTPGNYATGIDYHFERGISLDTPRHIDCRIHVAEAIQ